MKLIPKPVPDFKSISFELVIESQQELDGMAAIFNHTGIVKFLGLSHDCDDDIRGLLEESGAADPINSEAWHKLRAINL